MLELLPSCRIQLVNKWKRFSPPHSVLLVVETDHRTELLLKIRQLKGSKSKRLEGYQRDVGDLFNLILNLNGFGKSQAQFKQDIFAWVANGMKRGGFFVEFGGTDGVNLSNSYLLEKEFGWAGIIAEPGRSWHEALKRNRSCALEFDCVWKASGETLEFNLLEEAALSTITQFNASDGRNRAKKKGETYMVNSISLKDMLDKHGAPEIIDFLSIDTEGSEFDILNAFDFDKYSFNVVTCEHNFAPIRDDILKLMQANGYQRVLPTISHCDDWFVNERLLKQ